eukprot:42906-Chlamydomonas_euryale.AAC.1
MSASGTQFEPPESEADARRRLLDALEWEPPGDKYVYNEETGMLNTQGAWARRRGEQWCVRFGVGERSVDLDAFVPVSEGSSRASHLSEVHASRFKTILHSGGSANYALPTVYPALHKHKRTQRCKGKVCGGVEGGA